ncbi:fibrobacter succinogenes major paralogous domain-containing protein [Chryseobacterium arthrosphaerae]|nr:FISUMP domain-containing protein [Chryseobacterium arthrosphaerae]
MKKNTILLSMFLIGVNAFGQVGINTANPHPSASLELASTNKALYLNRVASTTVINNPQSGMIIYDLTDKCIKAYQGSPAGWSGCIAGSSGLTGSVMNLNCAGAYFTPSFATVGQAYTGNLTVPYSGGNGGIYPSQTFTVNGLTFNLPMGVFATGDGNVVYTVTGTPATAGTTSVNITIGGQSCSGANAISLTVNPATGNPGGVLPGTVTLAQNSRYWVASAYDNDYMPYTQPTTPATTAVINADGTPDTLVDVQGTVPTTGITVYIPATVTGSGGTVAAWSSTATIPANLTQNGVATQVTLSWATQNLTASNTSLVATIKAVGNDLLAKKLDLNAGIGNNYLGLLLGTFQYPYNTSGALTTYQLRDIPGIPDRMFGQVDNAGKYEHNFLYLPVQAEDGKIWLNNNLGANYADIDNPLFNLTQQATNQNDINAMGSLFQWGRKADGHELITRNLSISSQPTYKYGVITGQAPTWSPNQPNRINYASSFEWTSLTTPPPGNRWLASSPNNPCPQGFKVPIRTEWQAVITASGSGGIYATNKKLKLTNGGEGSAHSINTGVFNTTTDHYMVADGYSTAGGGGTSHVDGGIVYTSSTGNNSPGIGGSVRCIQE